jgi:glyoxylase-like metal-dependent hydrolase (beta-lactamase superfamily II)
MPAVRELQAGIWHWEAPHPEWAPPEDWNHRAVSSYAIEDGDRLLLFDPLAVPGELEERAAGLETAIVLTSPWHVRDALDLAERLGAPVYVPPPDRDPDPVGGHVFRAGERLPVGVEAFPGREDPYDVVLWVESRGAVVAGDTLVDRGRGLEILDDWLPEDKTHEQVVDGLRPLLELPVELVLATHGGPTDRAALERALA